MTRGPPAMRPADRTPSGAAVEDDPGFRPLPE